MACVSVAEATVERAFSNMKTCVTRLCNSLSPETVEAQLQLNRFSAFIDDIAARGSAPGLPGSYI